MASILNVIIHSDISEYPSEKRFDANINILELKKKLELITGANHKTMKITLFVDEKMIGELDNDKESLSYFTGGQIGKDSTIKLMVKDEQSVDLLSGDVPKYTISEDKYKERPDNVRNFIKELREKNKS